MTNNNENIKQNNNEEVIVVENLKKAFPANPILNGISLKLRAGENVGVLGKSGIGKSVLIKCIVRLLEADEGKIEVFGKDVFSLNHKELLNIRRQIGFLFQGGALYDSMTVRENLAFPVIRNFKNLSDAEIEDMSVEALENVGLLDAIDKVPSELSGGMKKRIGLARTLIMKPKVIFYDEPTTGLDPQTSQEISELILSVQEKYNSASLIITHDMKCARITTDRMLFIRHGVFYKEGIYDELKNTEDKWVKSFFE
ncbi:MAG: ATP-binding cassette domain-containing protein [Bacteroidota bacterium]|nr:ATP-binding cassette domain-containing protein [Bacteroidota bacterium]